ncbi:hypothetical protein A0H81_11655 [Grifola frondosa]|uniref:Uncharacterized protein n=1 Tax=Grifola frondosa TaxID=5627 RepID=A0A1C7LWW6_GRIFR|nr:hypothetical protein A0H81_11655 [Grifola frondosa]
MNPRASRPNRGARFSANRDVTIIFPARPVDSRHIAAIYTTPSTPNARSSVLSSALPGAFSSPSGGSGLSVAVSLTAFASTVSNTITDPAPTFSTLSRSTLIYPRAATALPILRSFKRLPRLISSLVLPSVIGIIVWLIFAIIRPRYRQIYGLREWFVQPSLRPKPLRRSFWAFLTPYVPLVPSISMDISDTGKSVAKAAELYPSDEQLIFRLLQLLDDRVVTTVDETVNGQDATPNTRIRIIIITVFAIALGVLPALWIIINEFNKLVAYRKRWVYMCCQGQEMGWLNARRASGFGWGEKRFKDYLARERNQDSTAQEKGDLEVDVQALFSIGDTTQVALLIDERDEILENLEVAETKYIQSFRLSTPDPSIADWHPPLPPVAEEPDSPPKPEISRPRPLGGSMNRRRRRRGATRIRVVLPSPTSYVMPSHFYRISDMEGITGGEFTGPHLTSSREHPPDGTREASLSDSSTNASWVPFQEVNRNSAAYGRIPMGASLYPISTPHGILQHLPTSRTSGSATDLGPILENGGWWTCWKRTRSFEHTENILATSGGDQDSEKKDGRFFK